MIVRKKPRAEVKAHYGLYVQFGFIFALLLLVIAFRLDYRPKAEVVYEAPTQEVVQMEEILQTKQIQKPPPPPRPPVPVEVPNDEILEEEDLDLDASLDITEPLADMPPPPPPDEAAEEEPEEVIFVAVEQMPELIGGLASVQSKIEYPVEARRAGIEGRVVVEYIVDEQGRVIQPRVVRGIGGGCDEEAIRVVKLATFKPGKQRGKPVKVKMSMPILFRLKRS